MTEFNYKIGQKYKQRNGEIVTCTDAGQIHSSIYWSTFENEDGSNAGMRTLTGCMWSYKEDPMDIIELIEDTIKMSELTTEALEKGIPIPVNTRIIEDEAPLDLEPTPDIGPIPYIQLVSADKTNNDYVLPIKKSKQKKEPALKILKEGQDFKISLYKTKSGNDYIIVDTVYNGSPYCVRVK